MFCMLQPKRSFQPFLPTMTLIIGCAKTNPPDAQPFIERVSEHLIAVESLDSPLPEASLQLPPCGLGLSRLRGGVPLSNQKCRQLL